VKVGIILIKNNFKMEKQNKIDCEKILKLGKKIFVISEYGAIESWRYRDDPYGGSCIWLGYQDRKICINNGFPNTSPKEQGPYNLRLKLDVPVRDSDGDLVHTVFSCNFYGAPKLTNRIRKRIIKRNPNFKKKEFRIDPEQLISNFTYIPGNWINRIDYLYFNKITLKRNQIAKGILENILEIF
jgi:hypothetical protein